MLKRKLFSHTPANVHAVGLAFTIVVLVAGALSAGLFTSCRVLEWIFRQAYMDSA